MEVISQDTENFHHHGNPSCCFFFFFFKVEAQLIYTMLVSGVHVAFLYPHILPSCLYLSNPWQPLMYSPFPQFCHFKNVMQRILWQSCGQDLAPSLLAQSLVGELRSHKPCSEAAPQKRILLGLAFFFFCSQHNSEEIHPSRCIYHQFTTFCFCVAFHGIDTSLQIFAKIKRDDIGKLFSSASDTWQGPGKSPLMP